ncbi:uncharacterized protein LOC143219409 [Lasioglossum baleicum]|uniref:uncharacterized protein LOC143219409 n=1 Tax=Lasioglossum baleicum TaxID=434251 RepID=UPI003FCE6FB0
MSCSLTVPELKEKLKAKNLQSTGTKAELIKRLLGAGVTVEELAMTDDGCKEEPVAGTSDETRHRPDTRGLVDEITLRELDVLRRERDVVVRENELFRRELALLRETPRSEASASGRTRVKKWQELKEIVGEFGGNSKDFDRWEKQVRGLLSTYELDNHQAKALVCSRLTGRALKWYHSRMDCVELGTDELLKELKRLYGQRLDPLCLRRELETRKWAVEESFADYVHDKTILANRVPVSETELLSYVVDGIPNRELQIQAKVQCYKSVDEILTAFTNVKLPTGRPRLSEGVLLSGKVTPLDGSGRPPIRHQTTGPSAVGSGRPLPREGQGSGRPSPREGQGSASTGRRCFNCNEPGHFSADCTKPARERGSCFTCGQMGHRANQCSTQTTRGEVNYITRGRKEVDDFRRAVELQISSESGSFSTKVNALIDSGSPISFVKEGYIPRMCFMTDRDSDRFHGINGSDLNVLGKMRATIIYDAVKYYVTLRIVPDETMKNPLVLGRDFMKIAKLSLSREETVECNDIADIMNIEVDQVNACISADDMHFDESLSAEIKTRARELFNKTYINAQRPAEPSVENTMKLTLTNDKPFSFSPRRLSYDEKNKLRCILDGLLERGIIRESTSEYASPIVLTKKKNGEIRMCVDFRTLNKITVRDNFPLPLIEDQLDLLEGKKYFTTLDLKDGFFHVKMDEASVKFTSFVTPFGQYEYTRMPFGLKGAPLKFQRYVTEIFKELINEGEISVYLDDFLIATETIEHHMEVLGKVFKLLTANLLNLRLDKCRFLQTKLDYLGYTVTNEGIRPTEQGLEAVKKFPLPRNVREVQGFLGLCSYFRKFIEGFSILAKPLYDLTRKDAKFQLGEKEKQAFEMLKNRLLNAPILSIYSPRDETELHCDASASGFGAILLQRKADKKLHPVFYFSKRTTEIESRYHSFELETLAIVSALRRFRTYLLGIKFKILTDCQALSLTLNKKETNPRIARWVLEMQNYDYVLEHRAGSRMLHVDSLSRQVLVIEDNSFDRNLALCQHNDKDIEKIRTELETTESKLYEMRNGLVYRKYQDTYWFPDMRSKIEKHIRGCLKCIAYTPNYGKLEVDAFTKYIKMYPTKTTNTADLIKCLKSYFEHYSRPLRIVSDRGSCFTSREFDEFTQEYNIQHVMIATASPQANGQVERYNRTILPMIAKLMSERGVVWHNVLREVEFACNNTFCKSTNKSPSMLLVGDKVFIKNYDCTPGVSTKMIPRFKGPYEIDRVLRNDRYVIKDVEGFQLSQIPYRGTWEAANMRPWQPSP